VLDDIKASSKGPLELNSTFKLSMKGGKISMKSEGYVWSSSRSSRVFQNYSRCFNGTGNKALLEGKDIVTSGVFDHERQPAIELTNNTHYVPLWLAFTPAEMLSRMRFDTSHMSVSDARAFHQGKECIEVSIPRDRLKGQIYVDPSLGYLPVKFVEWRRAGKMRSDIELEYVENEVLGWVVSRWWSNLYDGDEKLATSLSGTVDKITLNQPISDDEFDIKFPVGTSIREIMDGKTKYFIQERNGRRRATSDHDVGGTKGD